MNRKIWLKKDQLKFIRENINKLSNQELADSIGIEKEILLRAMATYRIKRDLEFQKELMSHTGENHPNWKGGIKQNNYHYTQIQRERYPEKSRARLLLKKAIERGNVIKLFKCEDCGAEFSDNPHKIHGHHDDYNKPLEVHWVCRDCHRKRHGGTH